MLGLNTKFGSLNYKNFDEYSFSAPISLLDYDSVVIDTDSIANNYSKSYPETYQNKRMLSEDSSFKIIEDYKIIKEQMTELLQNGKNIFLLIGFNENCCIYTGTKELRGTGRNATTVHHITEFNTYSFLPFEIKVTNVFGEELDCCSNYPYNEFFRKTTECNKYEAYFEISKTSKIIAKIKGSSKVISAVVEYENGKIILLPQPYYEDEYITKKDWKKYGKIYLDSLFELNENLRYSNENYILPIWTEKISILGEKDLIENRNSTQQKIEQLQQKLEKQEKAVRDIQKYKRLFTASGDILEEIVIQVLSELGFMICETEKGRSDVIAKYKDIDIVAEIKGITKSAAEKHAAQLEKWVSTFLENNDRKPKPILIVNAYCDLPLMDRNEEIFPNQMIGYSTSRNHLLLSTTQLLCLYIEIKKNPDCKEERIKELLKTVGIYNRYENIFDYINQI